MTQDLSLEGFDVRSLPLLENFVKDAVLYIALNDEDRSCTFEMLSEYIYQRVGQMQLPTDLVKEEQLAELRRELVTAINTAISGIETPTLPASDVTSENLGQHLEGNETFTAVTQAVATIQEALGRLQIPDLESYLKVTEGTPINRTLKLNAAKQLIASNFGSSRLLYVVGRKNPPADLFKDGSLDAPFASIQEAIDAANSGSNVVIQVLPSEGGDYAGFTVKDKVNTTVVGVGLTDAHMVRIVGAVHNSGTGTRFRLKDLQIKQAQAATPAYTSVGTQGRDYFDNVTFEPFNSSQTTPVVVLEDVNNWIDFKDSNVSGGLEIRGTAGAGALVAMRGGNATSTHVVLDSQVKLLLNNCTRFGSVVHNQGDVEINHCHTFTGKGGLLIKSGPNGKVSLNGVNFRKADGTYLGLERHVEGEAVVLTKCTFDQALTSGPVKDLDAVELLDKTFPEYTLGFGGTEGNERLVDLIRVASKGYHFFELKGELLLVGEGEDPSASEHKTVFTHTYGQKTQALRFDTVVGKNTVYLSLTDPDNNDANKLFGPFMV